MKRGNTNATRETIDKTEDPGLIKNRTDDLEDPVLVKNRSDCSEDPALIKNRSKIELSEMRLRAPNELSNELSENCLSVPNESAKDCPQVPNKLAKSCLQTEHVFQNSTDQCSNCSQIHCESLNGIQIREKELYQTSNFDTVFASHNQADLRYSIFSRGNQCTCMSLSVILALQEDCQISTLFLDKVLYEGDNLYNKVVMDLKREGKFINALLSFDELPAAVEYRNKYFSLTKHSSVSGLPIVETESETLSLHEGIIFGFSKSKYLLIMYGALCSVVLFIGNKYLFFDSHSHGHDGLSAPDGKSMMKMFSSMDDLIAFMYIFYTSCNLDLISQFEILPITVDLLQHEFLQAEQSISQNDQSLSHDVATASKSKDRICNMRSNKGNRDVQLQRERHVIRKLKANIKYTEKELLGKRNVKDNETFRERDMRSERKSRSDENLSFLAKTKDTDDDPYSIKELQCKENSEQDQKFYEQSRSKKSDKRKAYMKNYMQKRRKCLEFTEKENEAKKMARNDESTQNERQKDLLAKRKKREDEKYRENERKKELSAKRKKREDEKYRENELSAKRKQREDEKYRENELSAKRKQREDENYRENELSAKRKQREDENYR